MSVRVEEDPAWAFYFKLATRCHQGAADMQVYNRLLAVDSDLSVPRRVDWVFLYRDEESARAATHQIEPMGLGVSVHEDPTTADWVVTASSVEPLPLGYVVHMSAESLRFAASTGGRYDGWGAEVANPRS